jgi:hypothetical protein
VESLSRRVILMVAAVAIVCGSSYAAGKYKNFKVSIYTPARVVQQMGDPAWLESHWKAISDQLKVDKIYLETHRDELIVDEKIILAAKKFFQDRGIETAGGITYTISERNRFQTFCYSNPDHRQWAREIAEYTARLFDEVILDDFFFTNCKCDLCIKAKGDRSWSEFRLGLMDEAGRELIYKPAKAVNPRVKLVIKYPNWYEHFQGLGFNLETQPKYFDGIYTGTETRDAVRSEQHLQPYHGYSIFRYFENIKPGGNGGGWVDPFGSMYVDRYAEQLALTLFAKAPEITLFEFSQIQRPLGPADRPAWAGQGSSFDYDAIAKPFQLADGATPASLVARAANYTFDQVDAFLDKLGKPQGIKSYRPYHAAGEDFLQSYLGMIGLPIEMVPEFPAESPMILLTATAAADPNIVEKIKGQLAAGKRVIVTSGLLAALQGRGGLDQIAELRLTDRKAFVKDFISGRGPIASIDSGILIPEIAYLTNDTWEEISALAGQNGFPILHSAGYSKGTLYVLTMPDNFADLYRMPDLVLNGLREDFSRDLPAYMEGPSLVSVFLYDNNTLIVESFRDEPVTVSLVPGAGLTKAEDLVSGEQLAVRKRQAPFRRGRVPGETSVFDLALKPHSYRVVKLGVAQ